MLDSLRKVGKEIGRELNRAWENLSDGWRELLSRSGNALTHFSKDKLGDGAPSGQPAAAFPSWSLLAGEVEETPDSIIVRLEVPGMTKEDCHVSIEGNVLHLRGEKRLERESQDGYYHVMERAYGRFERMVPLPQNVDSERADANYRNGVLTVRLPKTESRSARKIDVL